MARRKRVLDESDSDASGDSDNEYDFPGGNADERDERALFDDPYKRKRRKRNGKEDALYGVFADSDDDEGRSGSGSRKKRSDWAKAPAFVTGEKKVDLEKDLDVDMDRLDASDEEQDENDVTQEYASSEDGHGAEGEDEPSLQPSEAEDDPEDLVPQGPRIGRIGFSSVSHKPSGPRSQMSASSFTRGGIGSSSRVTAEEAQVDEDPVASGSRPQTTPSSFSRGGIGSSSRVTMEEEEVDEDSVPSSFGKTNAFSRASTAFAAPKPAPNLNPQERAHFNNISGSFGARMLAKMGWNSGTGLGTTGEGIVTPIESKLRPQKMGLAYRNFTEKTAQSKAEAKRRGEVVSDDEEEKGKGKGRGKGKAQTGQRSDAWKKPKKTKVKVEHKTYEEILAETAEQTQASGIGMIIDATGATPREVSSLADVSRDPWGPSSDPTRIPEVRHNLQLIADICKSDLDGLAREGKELASRKSFIANEDLRLRRAVAEEAELINRLQKVHIVVDSIQAKSRELSSSYDSTLEPLNPLFCQLLEDFPTEFDKYRLDEIVVAAIAPIVRRMVQNWDPLADPSYFSNTFRSWKRALKVDLFDGSKATQVTAHGDIATAPSIADRDPNMTPFESLLWNVMLPRIRSALNNEWSPENPTPAVKLFESWTTFVPSFIRDNMLDQLILPKIHKAVVDWHPRKSTVSLRSIVFPWLPHVGLRLEEFLSDSRRKIKSILRSWTVQDEIPADLAAWKSVFDAKEWDALMLKYIVPKLGATLRNDFRINPLDQKMEPFICVLSWAPLLRSSIIGQLLETAFFPQWLDILHTWLIQPTANLNEVSQWYEFWMQSFPEDVRSLPAVSRGRTAGLDLMNGAMALGSSGRSQLPRPDFAAIVQSKPTDTPTPAPSRPPAARTHEVTFKSLVEEHAASHNLLFLPTGRAHEKSRMPLYRVSASVDGKGGLTVYVLDDAVWAPNPADGADPMDYRAISLDDMVLRANRSRAT